MEIWVFHGVSTVISIVINYIYTVSVGCTHLVVNEKPVRRHETWKPRVTGHLGVTHFTHHAVPLLNPNVATMLAHTRCHGDRSAPAANFGNSRRKFLWKLPLFFWLLLGPGAMAAFVAPTMSTRHFGPGWWTDLKKLDIFPKALIDG